MANTKVTSRVLADDAVGLAQLNISNDPSNGQALTYVASSNDLQWATISGGLATTGGTLTGDLTISKSDPILNIARSSNYTYKIGSLANDTFVIQSNESSNASYYPLIEIDSYAHQETVFLKGDANGKLGVGTTTPTEKVTVNGALTVTGAVSSNPANSGTLSYSATSSTTELSSYANDATADGIIAFRTGYGGAAPTTAMTITGGGNVGIGFASGTPAARLDIKGNTTSYAGMAKIYLTDTASNSESRNWAIGNGGSGYGHFTIGRSVSKNGDPMSSGTHTTPFVIDHQDNVGIGDNTSPAYTLEVKKDVAGDWISRIYNTNATTGYGALIRTDATSANDAIALGVYADSGYKMVVRSTGKVGIGVTSIGSNAHLQVNGGIRFNPFSAGHGLNVVSNQTFNNSNTSNSCGTLYYKCFIINIYHNNGHSQVFGIANGGGGVGFDFTIIRPDTATAIHGRPIDFSFTTIGSSPNTFRIQISSGGGALTVRRTSGTGSFGVQVHNIAGG